MILKYSVLGTTFIIWASVGNSIYPTNPAWAVVGMFAVVLFVLLPYFKDFRAEIKGAEAWFSTEKSDDAESQMLYHLSVICGFLLVAASSLNLFYRVFQERLSLAKHVEKFCNPGVHLEMKVKQASSYKVNLLVRNACEVHKAAELDGGISRGTAETKYGKAMLAYAKTSDQRETFGGSLQTWKRIFNGNLFTEDGISFTTHLLAGNVAQCTICLLLGAFFIQFYRSDEFQQGLVYLDKLDHGSQRWRLLFSLLFGFICGETTIIVIASNYIPSTVRTIQQYRSGGFGGSLHSTKFLKLRFAVDQASLLFGSIFWGTLYTSIITGVFCTLLMGIILWPDFAQLVTVIFANIIGILLTILLKWIALISFRRKNQKAYYRRSVPLTNFVGVILESWVSGVRLVNTYLGFLYLLN